MGIHFTDRYRCMGWTYHKPTMSCSGKCEGVGLVPVAKDNMNEPWRTLWLKAEQEKPSDDGWHFVRCPDCNDPHLVEVVEEIFNDKEADRGPENNDA